MRRVLAAAAALLTFTGMLVLTATASRASACQPDGTGCTKAGTYPGPNVVINGNYTGFKVVWTESVVEPYSSGEPLYWIAYLTYTNVESSTLTLGCPGDWADASFVSEHMAGGSGDDGTVAAESTSCSRNPDLTIPVPPGGTSTFLAIFHNVPWPGSSVAITWGSAGTSPYVYPFGSSPPSPKPTPTGKACVFNAPKGGVTVTIRSEHISGHVGWAYLIDPAADTWEYGANEGPISADPRHLNDISRTWHAAGNWASVLKAFTGPLPRSGASKGYYHPGAYYKSYRCVSVAAIHPAAALHVVRAQNGEVYSIPNFDCLSQTVQVLGSYGAPIGEHLYLLNPYYWVPNHYYKSGNMSKFGPKHQL
jgi:hypothetical protein